MKVRGRIKGMKKGLRKNQTVIMGTCIIFLLLIISLFIGSNLIGQTALATETTTTETTTTTTETTTTTTTVTEPPIETNLYKIKFSFLWGDSIAEADKVWVEFAAYDYHDITAAGKRDQVTLAAGWGDTGDWFYGSWSAEFTEGETLSIAMESYSGWYDFEDPFYVDVVVGPWSNSFTFYSYKYGFSAAMTSELRITWELV